MQVIGRVLCAAAALVAASAASASAGQFNAESFTLKNGLQVVVVPFHRAPVVTQMVWYKVGAADDPPGKSGIAHFLEHLMFRGTKETPPGAFSRIISENGGRDNAFTTEDYTAFYQSVAADKLDLAMKLESERMHDLVITEAKVTPEREVIIEERRTRIEVAAAKTYLIGSFPLSLDSTSRVAGLLVSMQEDKLGIDYLDRRSALLGKVAREDVRRVARRLLDPDTLRIVVVGDPKSLPGAREIEPADG